jgi:hypothetical protein
MRSVIALALTLLLPTALLACLWDYDTLKMERRRFPNALELITGKFLRHSPEFYAWRIRDRQERLQREPENLALYDDLAVAYDKTGQRDQAIATILKKNELKPGVYETEANLGTFLMLDGKLDEALPHLEKAIEINPDAHFGREKYQVILLQYVQSRKQDGKITFPLAKYETSNDPMALYLIESFDRYLASKLAPDKRHLDTRERAAAIKGVLGMMKFADHESPLLLEALGNLLADLRDEKDAKQLAARAYLKASYVTNDEESKAVYRKMAQSALYMQRQPDADETSLEQVEGEFHRELQEANEWYAALREKELAWIKEGKNADEEFDRLYDESPRIAARSHADVIVARRTMQRWLTGGGVMAIVLLSGVSGILFVRRRSQAK